MKAFKKFFMLYEAFTNDELYYFSTMYDDLNGRVTMRGRKVYIGSIEACEIKPGIPGRLGDYSVPNIFAFIVGNYRAMRIRAK